MSKTKPTTVAGKSDDATKAEQPSVHSESATEARRLNVQMVQNVLLIWLDNKIDDTSADCRNTISQLRRAVNTINTFTDGEQCIQFLENINNEKACMIISGALGQHIVTRAYEQWARDWSKIKGVFTEINPICDALKQAAQ